MSVNNSRFVLSNRDKKLKEINLFIDLDALRICFELVVNAGKHTKHDGGIILAKATYLCVIVSLIDHKSSITPSPSLIPPPSPPRALSLSLAVHFVFSPFSLFSTFPFQDGRSWQFCEQESKVTNV